MRVRFWGTRGSHPRRAHDVGDIQRSSSPPCRRRAGPPLDTPEQAQAFVDASSTSPFPHLRRQLLVRGARDGRRRLRAVRPRQRRAAFGNHVLATPGRRPATRSRVHVPRALGPHHGLPVLHARLHPGNRMRIYGCHAELEEAFRRQHAAPSFPVDFSRLGARIEFVRLEPGRDYEIAGLARPRQAASATPATPTATASSAGGKVVVYSTDSEHKLDDPRGDRGVRRVLPRRRPRDLRRHVLARRRRSR